MLNDFVPGSHYAGGRSGTLCPMKTIRLINGRTYFPPPRLRPCNHLSRTVSLLSGLLHPLLGLDRSLLLPPPHPHKIRPGADSD